MQSRQNNVSSRLIVSQSKCDERQFWYLSHPSTLFKDMYLPTMTVSEPWFYVIHHCSGHEILHYKFLRNEVKTVCKYWRT